MRRQIETALEKENLDRETELAKVPESSNEKPVTSSSGLKEELEAVQQRAERYLSRKRLDDFPEVKVKQEALLTCFA